MVPNFSSPSISLTPVDWTTGRGGGWDQSGPINLVTSSLITRGGGTHSIFLSFRRDVHLYKSHSLLWRSRGRAPRKIRCCFILLGKKGIKHRLLCHIHFSHFLSLWLTRFRGLSTNLFPPSSYLLPSFLGRKVKETLAEKLLNLLISNLRLFGLFVRGRYIFPL